METTIVMGILQEKVIIMDQNLYVFSIKAYVVHADRTPRSTTVSG